MFLHSFTPPQGPHARVGGELKEDSVLVLVGGWPGEEASSYSPASTLPCSLDLPALPRPNMWDSLVDLVDGMVVACSMDYDLYIADRRTKDFQCWGLQLARSPLAWAALPPPPHLLFLSTSTVWGGRLAVVGGSQAHHQDLDQLNGTTHVQLYDPASDTWSAGPALPAPLFEGCAVADSDQGLLVLGHFETEHGMTNFYRVEGVGGRWRALARSRHYHTRPGCTVATYRGEEGLVAVSGRHAEFYSFPRGVWADLPPLQVRRAAGTRVSVGVSQGQVVVAGGWDMGLQEKAKAVEALQGAAWVVVEPPLVPGRTHQGEVQLPGNLCTNTATDTNTKTATNTTTNTAKMSTW